MVTEGGANTRVKRMDKDETRIRARARDICRRHTPDNRDVSAERTSEGTNEEQSDTVASAAAEPDHDLDHDLDCDFVTGDTFT